MNYTYKLLQPGDDNYYRDLISLFAFAFEDSVNYQVDQLSADAIDSFLADDSHIMLVVTDSNGKLVGGLVGYELQKFEQNRKEIFVYDLAIDEAHRRKGLASGLFEELKKITEKRGAYQIFVEAESDDEAAISFYRSLIPHEEQIAHHFTITIAVDGEKKQTSVTPPTAQSHQ